MLLLAACGAFGSKDGDAPAVYDVPCFHDTPCKDLDTCCDPGSTGTPTCMATCTGSGYSYTCNDAEDCRARGSGGVCCGHRDGANMLQTVCRVSCRTDEERLCDVLRSDDECAGAGQACTRYQPDLNIGGFARCQ